MILQKGRNIMLNKTNVRRTLVIGLGSLQFDEDSSKTISMLKAATKDNNHIKCTLDFIDEEELFGDIVENIMYNLVDGEQATVESEIFKTVCEYNQLMQNRSKRSKALSNNNKGNDKDDDEPKVAPQQTVKNNQPKKAEPKTEAPKATEQPKVEESKPVEPKVENDNDLDIIEKAIMNTQMAMSGLDKKAEDLIKNFRDGKESEENTVKAIEGLLLSDKTTITMIKELLKNIEIPKELIDSIIGQDGRDLSQVKELLRSENANLTDEQISAIEDMYFDELNYAEKEKVSKRLNKNHVDRRLFAILKTLMKIGVDELKNEISQITIAKNNDAFNETLNQIHDVMGDVTISPLIHVNESQPEMNNEEIRQWNETQPLFNNNQQIEPQHTVTQ